MRPSSAPGSTSSLIVSGIAEPRGFLYQATESRDLLRHASPIVTAVMVDAEFFLKRARRLFGADFVPAAKLARREGVDFILDPMWASIRPDLYEHIDGLRSVCARPGQQVLNSEEEAA